MRISIVTTLLFMASTPTLASQVLGKAVIQTKKFEGQNSGCNLKQFNIATFDNQFIRPDTKSRSSLLAASWETSTPDCVEDYGVVQYIRGCIYDISYDPKTQEIEKYFGHVRESRGQSIRFQHKTWEVDSVDLDPLYASYNDETYNESERFNWHKIISMPNFSFEHSSNQVLLETFFNRKNYVVNSIAKSKNEKTNRLFITDLPSGTYYRANAALGKDWIALSSLEFKTCLYKTKDIPQTGEPASFNEPIENGGPIVCFDWSDKSSPNFEEKTIERTEELDPFCFTEPVQE